MRHHLIIFLQAVLLGTACGVEDISAEIKNLLKDSQVPSLAAAVIIDGEIRAAGAGEAT